MLASPIIEGTLPAFYLENGTAEIGVPFSMSRAVNENEVKGYSLKIKNLQGSEYLATLGHTRIDNSQSVVYFKLDEQTVNNIFSLGSFYKAQLAYIDLEGTVGYYSTVGILKYTTKPTISILNLKTTSSNAHQYSYTGEYSQEGKDFTEKEYSYRFVVKNSSGGIVEDTGFIIHNNSNDTEYYKSTDEFLFLKDLELNEKFVISYTVRTNNGLEISSPNYKIVAQTPMPSSLSAEVIAVLDYDNAYVAISLKGSIDPETKLEKLVRGSFLLARASEQSNYTEWEVLDKFNLNSQKPSVKSWKDFTIEQGVNYKYSIQQYNKQNLYSERILSNVVYADFEDSFLYDGEKQLKIRFNPKVSSFKKDLLEAKVDTIGSKYPFIFRNGQVEYKEFPISGLISRISDEQGLFNKNNAIVETQHRTNQKIYHRFDFPTASNEFVQKNIYEKNYLFYYIYDNLKKIYQKWTDYLYEQVELEKENDFGGKLQSSQFGKWDYVKSIFIKHWNNLYYINTKTISSLEEKDFLKKTDEISENIYNERLFKLEVLDWLTNGQPKLFKSPNEGNYLVRLMNSSLTPNDSLGRMLHNFSCTAYEIDEVSYDTLLKYGIISISNTNNKYLRIISVPLMTSDRTYAKLMNLNGLNYTPNPNEVEADQYYATGNLLVQNRTIEWADLQDVNPGIVITIDNESIVIGATGSYHIPTEVSSISLTTYNKVIFTEEKPYEKNKYYLYSNGSYITATDEYDSALQYYEKVEQTSSGVLTYAYYGEMNDSFSQITSTAMEENIGRQFIGEHENIIGEIKDTVSEVSSIYNARFIKRPVQNCNAVLVYKYYPFQGNWNENKEYLYYLENGEYLPAKDTAFNGAIQYYYRREEYDILNELGQIVAHLDYKDKPSLVGSYFENPLVLYKFKKSFSVDLNTCLYRRVTFLETEHQDTREIQDRTYPNRTSTNPYLMNIKDFELFVQHGLLYIKTEDKFELLIYPSDFNENAHYYIREDIEFYLDPKNLKTLYIGKNSYKGFRDTEGMGLESIFPLGRYNATAQINSNETSIDLTDQVIFNTGPMNDVSMITTSVGTYTELFYQSLIMTYDISTDPDLQILKNTLDEYKYKLSKEYMIKRCIESTDENSKILYIQDLEYIYSHYASVYARYLAKLNKFLEALEEA